LLLLPIPDKPKPGRKPHIINMRSDYGYATVIVKRRDQVVYRHPHPLDELIAEELRAALPAQFPDEDTWSYRVVGPGIPSTVRQAPEVSGAVAVEPYEDGERPAFRITRIEPAPLPRRSLLEFVPEPAAADRDAFAKVLVHPSVFSALGERRAFSRDVEE